MTRRSEAPSGTNLLRARNRRGPRESNPYGVGGSHLPCQSARPSRQVTEPDRASVGWRSDSSSPAKQRPAWSRSSAMSSIARRARSAASRPGSDRRARRCLEQVAGIEPGDSGVAHRRVTSTLHLLGGLCRDLGLWRHLGVERRGRCSKTLPPYPSGATRERNTRASSFSQELNLDLSGFSRARSPLR